jgi:hypothetical protein
MPEHRPNRIGNGASIQSPMPTYPSPRVHIFHVLAWACSNVTEEKLGHAWRGASPSKGTPGRRRSRTGRVWGGKPNNMCDGMERHEHTRELEEEIACERG